MSTYVLVHGAWHGGWCWDKVIPLLEKEGHKVLAPDLPGHGNDKTPMGDISLQAYVDSLCKLLDDQLEPVILVGHSMGGVVITQTAEYRPDKIKKLVYVTAFLLQDGESLLSASKADKDSLIHSNQIFAEEKSYVTINESAIREIFYGDCSEEDVERATSLFRPQAARPVVTPVSTTLDNYGRVPRLYISCLADKAISPSMQRNMLANLPCEKVIEMDSSHSPFYSAPGELARHLHLI